MEIYKHIQVIQLHDKTKQVIFYLTKTLTVGVTETPQTLRMVRRLTLFKK